MARGIKIEELEIGEGPVATRRHTVRVNHDWYLSRGEKVLSEVDGIVDLARRHSIAGLRYGIEGMREGGRRRVRVDPHLAYKNGVPGLIPANALLIIELELLEVFPEP